MDTAFDLNQADVVRFLLNYALNPDLIFKFGRIYQTYGGHAKNCGISEIWTWSGPYEQQNGQIWC